MMPIITIHYIKHILQEPKMSTFFDKLHSQIHQWSQIEAQISKQK